MHAVVHVEIPVTDLSRAKEWYAKIFGWEIREMGDSYALWSPPGGPGSGAAGGLYVVKTMPQAGVQAYIEVADLNATLEAITKAGGKVTMEKTEVASHGWYAGFTEPQGAQLFLWETAQAAR